MNVLSVETRLVSLMTTDQGGYFIGLIATMSYLNGS